MSEVSPEAVGQPAAASVDPDYPLTEVPQSARRGLLSLMVVLLGFTFFTPTMLAGAQIGAAFALDDFVQVILWGSLILGLYVAVLATIGARTGLTTVLLARFTLGTGGAKWADVLLGGTQVGWYAVTVAFLAQLLAVAFGVEGVTWLLMIVGGALMGVTAYYGYRGMEALSALSVPLMFILAFWVMARALGDVGGWSGLRAAEPAETMAVGTALTIVVGTFASGGTQTPNWSRFARFPWQGFIAALAAFFVATLLAALALRATNSAFRHPLIAASLIASDVPSQLPVPVKGVRPADLRDSWGAPRSEGRQHRGIDIFAPRGRAIVSATRGIVVTVGVTPRGGRIVRVLGPGGQWHYYAHLDRYAEGLAEGDMVKRGQVIGYVGSTGLSTGFCATTSSVSAASGGVGIPSSSRSP